MISRRQSLSRWLALAAWLAATLAMRAVAADEKETPAAPTPKAEGGITAAKREFEAVKSARDPALQQSGELPRLTMPEMRPETAAGALPLPSSKPTVPEKKSTNWLLEAMEKKEPRKESERRGRSETETNERREMRVETSAGEQSSTRREEPVRQSELDRKLNTPPDPMARFLSEWMTPQDYALLKPGLARSANEFRPNAKFGQTAELSFPGPDTEPTTGGPTTASGPTAAIPRENPYLSALNLVPPTTQAGPAPVPAAPPVSAARASLPSTLSAPPPPVAPAKSKVPDFAKPAQDEKYYKQLKRF